MMIQRLVALLLFVSLFSCSPVRFLKKEIALTEKELKDHTGFMLYDPVSKKSIYEHQSSQHFTPASNTKIFTFYAGLQLLKDSIPALRYQVRNDSLIVWGTGDPSFLYPEVHTNSRVVEFLSDSTKKLFFSTDHFRTTGLGAGWSWDDYNDYYSAERTSFPVFGNLISIQSLADDRLLFSPGHFSNQTVVAQETRPYMEIVRDVDSNQLTVYKGEKKRDKKFTIPFHYDDELFSEILADTLNKSVDKISRPLPTDASTLYSIPADSLYKVMMQESDNFIAEQLLLLYAGMLSDTLKPEIAIRNVKENFMKDFPDEPAWVDGSGLSRYNLFTPRTIVELWRRIYQQVPRERLFSLLAIGGKAGTIRNSYKGDSPYVYGKTGSLSNNHCLSGFVLTKKKRTLIFSFMSNNFVIPTSEVRKRMEKILSFIHEKY